MVNKIPYSHSNCVTKMLPSKKKKLLSSGDTCPLQRFCFLHILINWKCLHPSHPKAAFFQPISLAYYDLLKNPAPIYSTPLSHDCLYLLLFRVGIPFIFWPCHMARGILFPDQDQTHALPNGSWES